MALLPKLIHPNSCSEGPIGCLNGFDSCSFKSWIRWAGRIDRSSYLASTDQSKYRYASYIGPYTTTWTLRGHRGTKCWNQDPQTLNLWTLWAGVRTGLIDGLRRLPQARVPLKRHYLDFSDPPAKPLGSFSLCRWREVGIRIKGALELESVRDV